MADLSKIRRNNRVFLRPFTHGGGQVQGDKALMGGDIDLMEGDLTLIDYIIN